MAIFYDKNSFCHVSGREAGLEGALVYYKRMTNSIRAFFRTVGNQRRCGRSLALAPKPPFTPLRG